MDAAALRGGVVRKAAAVHVPLAPQPSQGAAIAAWTKKSRTLDLSCTVSGLKLSLGKAAVRPNGWMSSGSGSTTAV